MKELNICPSTLAVGYTSYSPIAIKRLFDGKKASHLLNFEIDDISQAKDGMYAMRRISVSGAQEKFPAILDEGIIRLSKENERSWYILKPAPWDKSDVYDRTGHPCRLDFERFGNLIGLREKRISAILDQFAFLPNETEQLVAHSFLNDKMKRTYLRIVNERIARFNRKSE